MHPKQANTDACQELELGVDINKEDYSMQHAAYLCTPRRIPLSEDLIKQVHLTLMKNLSREGENIEAGQYRRCAVHAGDHNFVDYKKVPPCMSNVIGKYNIKFERSSSSSGIPFRKTTRLLAVLQSSSKRLGNVEKVQHIKLLRGKRMQCTGHQLVARVSRVQTRITLQEPCVESETKLGRSQPSQLFTHPKQGYRNKIWKIATQSTGYWSV